MSPLLSHYSRVVKVSFIRFAFSCSLCIFECEQLVCECECGVHTIVIRLFINVLLLIFQSCNESRMNTKQREKESNNTTVYKEESSSTHLDGESHTLTKADDDVHNKIRRFQFRQWLWFCFLVLLCFFRLPLCLSLFLCHRRRCCFFSSSLHVHFHPSIRIHMSAHKWLYHFEWRRDNDNDDDDGEVIFPHF